MNSRRNFLQFFGLGSLFTADAAVTPNQARAANGMEPIPSGFGPEFPPYTRTKWEYRVIQVLFPESSAGPKELTEAINRETADGKSEFVSMCLPANSLRYRRDLVFRKRVPLGSPAMRNLMNSEWCRRNKPHGSILERE